MAVPEPFAGPHPGSTSDEPRWGLGDALGGWVLAYAAALVVGGLVLAAAGYEAGDDLPLTVIALTYPPLWLGFVGVPIWAAATKGRGWVEDFHMRLEAIDVPVGIVVGVLAQIIVVPLISLPILELTGKTVDDLAEPAQELADKAVGGGGALLFLLIVGLCAPIAEELFFRGLVFRAFEKRWGQWWALAGSSVVFGATHFQFLQFAALTAAGAIFGLLVVKTNRLGPAIVAHMAFNTTTVVALLWLD